MNVLTKARRGGALIGALVMSASLAMAAADQPAAAAEPTEVAFRLPSSNNYLGFDAEGLAIQTANMTWITVVDAKEMATSS